jgi:hypothetical protein
VSRTRTSRPTSSTCKRRKRREEIT